MWSLWNQISWVWRPEVSHKRPSQQTANFQCNLCEKGYPESEGLKCHMKDHHKEQQSRVSMWSLWKRVSWSWRPEVSHQRNSWRKAKQNSNVMFVESDILSLKAWSVTWKTTIKNSKAEYQCDLCGKRYPEPEGLKFHMKTIMVHGFEFCGLTIIHLFDRLHYKCHIDMFWHIYEIQ